ncbi:nuclease-related domain-containing protein [Streptomyces sp. ID05-39B]|nr:nuclease-related domain-containing protein [Streptomyces sp. ID05-39B]
MAARWDLGAAAEATTAGMLEALHRQGWHVRHDRALPGSRANLDHVLISPCGTAVVVLDTKRWHASAQKPTWLVRGRVCCGTDDRHGQVEAVARYAARVQTALGMPGVVVWPLLVVHGSPVAGGELRASVAGWDGPVFVLSPGRLVPRLAAAPRGVRDLGRAAVVARRVDEVLRPYR